MVILIDYSIQYESPGEQPERNKEKTTYENKKESEEAVEHSALQSYVGGIIYYNRFRRRGNSY